MRKLILFCFSLLLLSTVSFCYDYQTTIVNAAVIDSAGVTTLPSTGVPIRDNHTVILYHNIAVSNDTTLATLKIEVLASHNDTTFYKINDIGRFNESVSYGSLNVLEAYPISVYGYNFMKIRLTSVGGDTTNFWTTSVIAEIKR